MSKKAFIAISITGIVVVLGGLIWLQQKNVNDERARAEEEFVALERERDMLEERVESLRKENMEAEKESAGRMQNETPLQGNAATVAPQCFSHILLQKPLDTTGWFEHRNHVAGYQMMRPADVSIERIPSWESQGLEVLKIFSSQYRGEALLRVYDLRMRRFVVEGIDGRNISYEVLPNKWYQQMATSDGGSAYQECAPFEAAKTMGQWPVYVIEKEGGDVFSRVYRIIYPSIESEKDRFPVALEFSLSGNYGVMTAQEEKNFEEFMKLIETMVQSVRFFAPQ